MAPDVQVLLVDCPDGPGLIHAISGVLLAHGANILGNHEFVDRRRQRFFMRTEFVGADMLSGIVAEVQAALPAPSAVRIGQSGRQRIVVLTTREPHCVGELLMRHAQGDLGASIAAVIGTDAALASLVERFDVPFHHVPVESRTRETHEADMLRILQLHRPDFVVLAKFMRVLTAGFVEQFPDRIINIHHSFLPAFVGSSPYLQAFERGVKIIGATAHFVTEGLDEGAIIAQDVVRVDHSDNPEHMAQADRDVEKIVLARALRLVFEDRIFLSGNRTVVFD